MRLSCGGGVIFFIFILSGSVHDIASDMDSPVDSPMQDSIQSNIIQILRCILYFVFVSSNS